MSANNQEDGYAPVQITPGEGGDAQERVALPIYVPIGMNHWLRASFIKSVTCSAQPNGNYIVGLQTVLGSHTDVTRVEFYGEDAANEYLRLLGIQRTRYPPY